MDTKSIAIYGINTLLVLGAGAMVFFGKITWAEFGVFSGALLVPSAAHVALTPAPDAK